MKVKVGDRVVTINRGELKVYEANPRTLEAEAGLKEFEVKLDLKNSIDYIAAHQKLHDVVSDQAGRFKESNSTNKNFNQGSISEEHNLENELEKRLFEDIAKDVNDILKDAPKRVFVTINEEFADEILDRVDKNLREKIVKVIKKDYVKLPKEKLLEMVNG